MEMLPFGTTENKSPKLVDAENLFLQKRYQDTYIWKPTPEIEEAIVKAIFGD